jgi:chromosome segregation ATPase
LKNEVEKIKKKMAVTITELEMSLDASNKNNGHLTMASKAQQQKIMELTAAMDKANMNLKGAGEQNMAFAGKIQMLEVDITKIRQVLEQTNNAKKVAEQKLGELAPKYTELTGLNNTLVSAKTKLEKDLVAVRTEYTDIARELKLADERANKASHDAQHFEGLLREEANKLVKCENTKKALETEMRSLTIRMEEIETNTVATSRRTIQKMEIRIEELEVLLSKEKQTHVETTTILHKKESSVKALLLQSEEDRKNIIILQESLDKLNEKIKMYKRQLEEQEQISNSNIMRVKKFQRELEASEARAEEAESSLNAFRSRARVFATAESKRETVVEEVERQVVVNKSSANVSSSRKNATNVKIEGSSTAVEKQNITDVRIGGSSSALATQSSAVEASSSRALRAGSTYSRAGSMARSSVLRAGSVGRAGSTFRY